MMTLKSIHRFAALTLVVLLTACAQQIKLEDPAADDAAARAAAEAAARAGQASGAGSNPMGSERPVAQVTLDPSKDPFNDPKNPLSKRSIFFDFDSFSIRDEFRPVVEAHARYLLSNKGRKVIVQGNTDERGSREYNLALGQKRAEAVRRALTALGVADSQIEAVSLGEEKPRSSGSDDSALAENRRADLVYQ
jgi:peptidoglycan-associated lipoprotein